MQNWMGGCLCDNWKPTFLPRFIFNWSTFLRQVTALWWRRWAESQVSTNQNLRNRWCQIVRQTTVYHGEVHFFNFRPEILFLGKFNPKIKNCLKWNLLPKPIQICRIRWRCSLFPFSTGNTVFWENWIPKFKIVRLKWNLLPRLIRICRIQWQCSSSPKNENCHWHLDFFNGSNFDRNENWITKKHV